LTTMTEWLDRKLYPNHLKNWDDRLFREKILSYLTKDSVVLDLGAGAGIVAAMDFRGLASRICGVDLDPRVEQNPMLHEGKVSDAGEIPYDAETFDVVFSDNVMEHIADPASVLKEAWRVLKPNGVLLFKTPNKFHYMPTIARWTPHRFHQFVNRLRGRSEADTFPTLYRINSRQAVVRFASDTGFHVVKISRIEGRPEYLRFSPLAYLLGAAYERWVNSTKFLEPFRILLVAELRRPAH
jgi:SAM-dependent methyltransferase